MLCARVSATAFGLLCIASCFAQSTSKTNPLSQEGYILPPGPVAEAALAPWYKNVTISNLSPDRHYFVVIERDGMPTLASLAKDHVNLGGVEIDTSANRARTLTTRSSKGIRIAELATGKAVEVPIRPDARVSDVLWSHDSKHVVFLAHFLNRSEIWVANASDGKCHAVTSWPVLATFVTTLSWAGDDTLATVLIPKNRVHVPERPAVATTPKVKVTDGKVTAIRTYPSLLQNPYEQSLLEFYTTGQLALVDLNSGKVKTVGKPSMIRSIDPAPDGKFFRVTVMEKPFSYIFPTSNFPQKESIWDDNGAEKLQLSKRGTQGEQATANRRGAQSTRRLLAWRPDGSGLSFVRTEPAAVEPIDGESSSEDEQGRRGTGGFGGGRGAAGQGAQAGPQRPDQLVQWLPNTEIKDAKVLFTTPNRINSLSYSADMKSIFIEQTIGTKTRLSVVNLSDSTHPVTLVETGTDDDPVSLSTTEGPKTGSVIRTSSDGKFGYVTGTKISKDPQKDAPKPFIEKIDLTTGKREPLFESKADAFEQPSILDNDAKELLVVRQSSTSVPNTFLLNTASKAETKLTENKDYSPDLTQARRETITVTRQDGFKFEVKVTLPRYFIPGSRPPAFFWFYPSEFVNQDAYKKSKRTFNKNLFTQVSGANKSILTRLGYTVVEPDCPIVGPADRKNDEYVPQLRNNLSAVIDELDRKGWIDRSRLGIGGHSYGAFSTANAMVNTPFFKAGIAGDGNFNRTLTPFGFQSDDRQMWDGRGFYLEMSPFLFAERITGALLMYHGMEDQNIGTDPINSERMFDALEALGKTAALYKYPYEDHGQVAQETVLDQWARFVAWLDKYVKGDK